MSECVVRMEMPESCFVCPFRLGCSAYRAYSFSTSTRRVLPKPLDEGCNILAVLPEGHGRLGDLDKLADDMKARKAFFGRMSDPQCLVEDAPTIVPAERSEL